MTDWLYEKEMEQIIGLIFQARNEMGAGWSEEIMHQALAYLLQKHDIPFQSKPRKTLLHRGTEIHTFEPDIIIWDKIILELKILLGFRGKQFPSVNQAQLLHYLKFFNMKLGLLVNFAHSKVGLKRMIYAPLKFKVEDDLDQMLPHLDEEEIKLLRNVYRHLKQIGEQYGLGYPETLYRRVIAVELAHIGIDCISDLNIEALFGNQRLGTQSTPYMLIENRFLLHIRSSFDTIPKHDYLKTNTYLRALDLKVGWLVNFGTLKLQIAAVVK